MDELHAAIAAFLRRQRPGPTTRRRPDPPPAPVREVAIYARVTGPLPDSAVPLSVQIAACRVFAAACGAMVGLVYAEVAEGVSLDRPRLAELRAAIAHGWVDTVLVTGFDRFTSDSTLLLALAAEWAAVGVAIVVVGE